jgi:hypoxanthine phosphoribosyltransferase
VSEVTKLIDERQIERRVHELAADIAKAISGEFTVVALLKGSFVFAADLVRALDGVGLAPRVEFLRLSSYGCGRESSGEVRLIGEVPGVEGRSVLLVDDITDSGWSLVHAQKLLRERGALEIRTCTLIDKPSRRRVDFSPDFVGFEVGDVFVVGYGIDFAEAHRHLPYIGRVE